MERTTAPAGVPQATGESAQKPKRSRNDKVLALIAIERSVRALVLIAIGIVLATHSHTDWSKPISDVAHSLGLDTARNGFQRALSKIHALSPRRITEFGWLAIGYGVLEAVEGYGLLRRRRWAEYLTVVATSLLFIPEIWELSKKFTLLKAGGFAVNVVIVAYLIWRLRRTSHEDELPWEERV